MNLQLDRRTMKKEVLIGVACAILLIIGRWTPLRLLSDSSQFLFFEQPRFWIVIALVATLFFLPKHKTADLLPKYHVLYLIVPLFVYLMFTGTWAVNPDDALQKGFDIFLMLISLVPLLLWLIRGDQEVIQKSFWLTFIILAGILGLIAILQVMVNPDQYDTTNRVSVLAGGTNAFGRMMGLLCLSTFAIVYRKQSLWGWIFPILAFLIVILTGSRGALLATSVGLVAFLGLQLLTRNWQTARWWKGSIAVVVAYMIVIMLTPFGQLGWQIFEFRVIDLTLKRQHLAGREMIYEDTLQILWADQNEANPDDDPDGANINAQVRSQSVTERVIFGIGISSFASQSRHNLYSHNIFLELLTEGGVISLGIFLTMLGVFAYVLFKYWHLVDPLAFGALTLSLMFSQFSGDIYDSRLVFILLMFCFIRNTTIAQPHPLNETQAS